MASEVVLVTGASSGIGAAFARRIARDGRAVVLVARHVERLETLAHELGGAHGVRVEVVPKDLAASGAVPALLEEVARRGCVVDWLVNNAAFGTNGRFDELPIERELEEIRLNVLALVELTAGCLPGMVQRRRGVVMNVASTAAFTPIAYSATYGATKAFVLSFTEAIATELRGSDVHVICVCPGLTRTEFAERAHVDVSDIPGFLWMSPEAVADEAVRAIGSRTVVVPGWLNTLMGATIRAIPPWLANRLVAARMRPRGSM